MRIAVIGPQNTGKSTFISDFLKSNPNYTSPSETYRDIILENNLEINQKTTEISQKLILDFLDYQIADNSDKDVIFDRCLIDNYVYTKCAALTNEYTEMTKAKALSQLDKLDLIVFIPASTSIILVDDELRDIDRVFLDKVNKVFLEILFYIAKRCPIPIKIVSGSRTERVLELSEYLASKSTS
jgi:nicotinamide riboside kinase